VREKLMRRRRATATPGRPCPRRELLKLLDLPHVLSPQNAQLRKGGTQPGRLSGWCSSEP